MSIPYNPALLARSINPRLEPKEDPVVVIEHAGHSSVKPLIISEPDTTRKPSSALAVVYGHEGIEKMADAINNLGLRLIELQTSAVPTLDILEEINRTKASIRSTIASNAIHIFSLLRVLRTHGLAVPDPLLSLERSVQEFYSKA